MRTTFPIVETSAGQIFAVVAGKPKDDSTFDGCCDRAFDAMEAARGSEDFKYDEMHHPRGDYAVVNAGVIYGQGCQVPCNLNTGAHAAMAEGLLKNEDIRRLAIYASGAPL